MSDIEFKRLEKEMAGKQKNSSSILLLTIITLLAIIMVWASITEIDNVTRGSGKTISEAKNQFVQSSEPGVLKKRYFSDGDRISKGDILFDIDPIEAKSQLDQYQKRFVSLEIKAIRLRSEVNGVMPEFSAHLIDAAPSTVSTELALYKARLDDLQAKSSILEQRRLQKLNEVQELKIQFETAINGLALIRREIQTLEPLVKNGLAPETRLISLQREEESTLGRANSAESGQKTIQSGLAEIEEQLKAENQAYITAALTDLSAIEGEISEVGARIPALEDRVERTTVRSPVDGVINRINYVTENAYVSSGDVLVEIVPTGSELIVQTEIEPKDIGEIVIGQDVKISLTAYNPNKYGRIDGKVLSISADAISDTQTGLRYYFVDVSIEGTLYETDGSEVTILPGMEASIDVLSGKRTILDYFWQPIANTKDKALKD